MSFRWKCVTGPFFFFFFFIDKEDSRLLFAERIFHGQFACSTNKSIKKTVIFPFL